MDYHTVRNIIFKKLDSYGINLDTDMVFQDTFRFYNLPYCDMYTLALPDGKAMYIFIALYEDYFCSLVSTPNCLGKVLHEQLTADYVGFSMEEAAHHGAPN